MGTRHLIRVIENGEIKVAQYGQWDGYPEGQGVTALEILSNPELLAGLRKNLSKVRWATEDDYRRISEVLDLPEDGWLTFEQGEQYNALVPHLSRDTGANILRIIAETTLQELPLGDSRDFIEDGLFCEWAYTVDFDENNFQVWTNGRTIVSYKLDQLPTTDEFVALTNQQALAIA